MTALCWLRRARGFGVKSQHRPKGKKARFPPPRQPHTWHRPRCTFYLCLRSFFPLPFEAFFFDANPNTKYPTVTPIRNPSAFSLPLKILLKALFFDANPNNKHSTLTALHFFLFNFFFDANPSAKHPTLTPIRNPSALQSDLIDPIKLLTGDSSAGRRLEARV